MSEWMRFGQVGRAVYAPDGRSVGSAGLLDGEDDAVATAEFDALMSLALDDRLSADEESEFNRLLAADAELDGVWVEWQAFDHAFRTTPHVEPPVDFVASFEDRLLQRERRRRLWFGFGVGAVALLLWSGLMLGLAGAGAYVMFNQADWLTTVVRIVAHASVTVQTQMNTIASALATALSTPQIQGMAIGYMLLAGLALWFWARFLHRSVAERQTAAAGVSS